MKVEFEIHRVFDYNIFYLVISELKRRGINYSIFTEQTDLDLDSRFAEFFRSNKNEISLKRDLTADIFIGFIGTHAKYKGRRVKFLYGVDSCTQQILPESSKRCKNHDAIFCYGNISKRRMSQYFPGDRIFPIGCLAYEYYKKYEENTKYDFVKNLDKKKKTIVYCTTWDEHCSVTFFEEELKELSIGFNIIIRLHITQTKSGWIRRYNDVLGRHMEWDSSHYIASVNRITKNIDHGDGLSYGIFGFADVVLADAKSGAIFDAVIKDYNNPVIGLSPFNDTEVKKLFYPEVFEWFCVVNKKGDLKKMVHSVLKNDPLLKKREKARYHIATKTNHIGRDVVDHLLEVIEMKKISYVDHLRPIKTGLRKWFYFLKKFFE